MAKRFGRNQRRKLRDLVVGLERKLYSEWERASGKFPDVVELTGPVLERTITDSETSRHKEKEAELLVYVTRDDGGLHKLMREQRHPLVEYDDYVWRVRDIQVELDTFESHSMYSRGPARTYIGGPPTATIKLTAEPARR